MKKVILGIGIPGSGKTSVLKDFASKNEYLYICPDDIRQGMTENTSDQSKNKEVWAETYKRVEEGLGMGKTIVVDATFTNSSQRKDFLNFSRKNGAEKIQGIYLDVDLEIARERNSFRERKVPEHVLERMHKGLQDFPPEIVEGFDSIFTLDDEQKLVEADLMYDEKVIHKEFGKFH